MSSFLFPLPFAPSYKPSGNSSGEPYLQHEGQANSSAHHHHHYYQEGRKIPCPWSSGGRRQEVYLLMERGGGSELFLANLTAPSVFFNYWYKMIWWENQADIWVSVSIWHGASLINLETWIDKGSNPSAVREKAGWRDMNRRLYVAGGMQRSPGVSRRTWRRRLGLTHPPWLCHWAPRGQAGGGPAASGRGMAAAHSALAAS